jgi:hypothetical protein
MYDFDFWNRVLKTETCWIWIGATLPTGYGVFRRNKKLNYAHRYVLELLGFDLSDKVVLHTCDFPTCCNPDHLKIGTHADNVADKVSKDRHVKGSACNLATVLDEDKVRSIKQDFKAGLSNKNIALKYNIDPTLVSKIKNNHAWSHV